MHGMPLGNSQNQSGEQVGATVIGACAARHHSAQPRTDAIGKLADIGEAAHFRRFESNAEAILDLHEELNVGERIPAGHVGGGRLARQGKFGQVEVISRNLAELGKDIHRFHVVVLRPAAFAKRVRRCSNFLRRAIA